MSMDAAYVLEQFQQDLSNVPAEVEHYLEEIKAKDMKLYTYRKRIQHCDNQIHKYIRTHGSLSENPKEKQYSSKIGADFEHAMKIQDEKCELANKLNDLITRHLKRLDMDIKKLQNDGLLAPSTEPITLNANRAVSLASGLNMSSGGATTMIKRQSPQIMGPQRSTSFSRSSTPGDIPFSNGIVNGQSVNIQRPLKRQKTGTGVVSVGGTPTAVNGTNSSLSVSMIPDSLGDSDAVVTVTNQIAKSGLVPRAGSIIAAMRAGGQKMNRGQSLDDEDEENNDSALYCFCQQVSYGDMIACDNSECKFEWFHYGCVGLKAPPSGLWYCSVACEQVAQTKKNRK